MPGETLSLRTTDDGVVLPVRVIPRASRTMLAGVRDGRLLVRLNAPPLDGAANEALIRLLAKQLDVARRGVRIVGGHRARQKNVLFEGVTAKQLLDRLTTLTYVAECVPGTPRGSISPRVIKNTLHRRRWLVSSSPW